MASHQYRIELLGAPRILRDGQPVQLGRRRVRALLYYLAAQQDEVSRSTLAWLLWPDKAPDVAQRNLSVHISYLRKDLAADIVTTTPDTVTLGSDVSTDVADVRRLSASVDADQILSIPRLFRGAFLEGFSLKGSESFDQWCSDSANLWNGKFIEASIAAAQVLEGRRSFTQAIDVLNKAIAADPLREELYRLCMRVMDESGQRAAVGRLYAHLTSLLSDELGVPPSFETVACYQEIIGSNEDFSAHTRSTAQTVVQRTADTPLIGRQTELQQMQQADRSRLLLVEGRTGVGKTRLLDAYIRRSSARTLRIEFKRHEREIPYFALTSAIKALTEAPEWSLDAPALRQSISKTSIRVLYCLVPELTSDPEVRASTFALSARDVSEAVSQLVSALSIQRPLLVAIDDIQYADDSSIQALRYLTLHLPMKNVQIVATFCTDVMTEASSQLFNDIEREDRLTTMELAKLDNDEMMQLMLFYLPDIDKDTASRLVALADGNLQWLQAIITGVDSGYTEFSGKESLAHLLDFMLRSLSPQARNTVERMALLGESCDMDLFARLCNSGPSPTGGGFAFTGRLGEATFEASSPGSTGADASGGFAVADPGHTHAVLTELTAAGLVARRSSQRVEFTNDTVRDHVTAQLRTAPQRMKAIHFDIAQAIEAQYRDTSENALTLSITNHYAQSTHPQLCGPFAARAADYLLQLDDIALALKYYRIAVRWLEGPERLDAVLLLCINSSHEGLPYEASLYLRSAISLARDQHRRDYELLFRAFQKLETIPEYREVAAGVLPSYSRNVDVSIGTMLSEARTIAEQNGASRLLTNYILGALSSYYLIIGKNDASAECLDQIISQNLWSLPEANRNANAMVYFSSLVSQIDLLKREPDPKIYSIIKLENETFHEVPIRSFSSTATGVDSLLAYIRKDYKEGDRLIEEAIADTEGREGTELARASLLVTYAQVLHKTDPERSHMFNHQAYLLARRLNARYTQVRALTGLVVTSISRSTANAYLNELRVLAGVIGSASLYDSIARLSKKVDEKPE